MKKYDFDFTIEEENCTVHCTGYVTEGSPAVMYLRNGDPGYPEEPPEVEFDIVECYDALGNTVDGYEFDYDELTEKAIESAEYDGPCAEDYEE